MIEFVPATTGDIAGLAALWYRGWHDAHGSIVPAALTDLRHLDSFADRITQNIAQCRIGQVDGQLGGFYIIRPTEIYQFYVGETARGTGFAAALMKDAQRVLRGAGCDTAWLSCSIGNNRAAAFYRKAGWVNVGTEQIDVDTAAGAFALQVWRFEKQL